MTGPADTPVTLWRWVYPDATPGAWRDGDAPHTSEGDPWQVESARFVREGSDARAVWNFLCDQALSPDDSIYVACKLIDAEFLTGEGTHT